MRKILLQFSMNVKNLENIITICKRLNISHDFFTYLSIEQIIDDFPDCFEKDTHFSFCSIPPIFHSLKKSSLHYKSDEKFKKYNENFIDSYLGKSFPRFEQDYILEGIKNKSIPYIPLLNEKAQFIKIKELSGRVFEDETFLKPSSSFKQFIGGTTLPGENFEDFLIRKKFGGRGKDIEVLMCPSYSILSEYRFFVFNGIPMAGSSYISNKKYDINASIPKAVQKEAERLASIYSPALTFVMDLCLLDNSEIKIVEYNHASASGQYNCIMDDYIYALCSP